MTKLLKSRRIWWIAAGLLAASFVVLKKKTPNKEKDILFIEPDVNQKLIHG